MAGAVALPESREMLAEEEAAERARVAAGVPARHGHMLGPKQWAFLRCAPAVAPSPHPPPNRFDARPTRSRHPVHSRPSCMAEAAGVAPADPRVEAMYNDTGAARRANPGGYRRREYRLLEGGAGWAVATESGEVVEHIVRGRDAGDL